MKIFSKETTSAWEPPKGRLYGDDLEALLEQEDTPKKVKSLIKYQLELENSARKWRSKIDREQDEWDKANGKLAQLGVIRASEFHDTQA